jgi:hypothetical protein
MTSVGADNPFGHPSPLTIGHLVASGARSYRTDRDGDVALVVRGGRLTSEARRGRGTVAARPRAGGLETIPGTTLTALSRDLSSLPVNWCGTLPQRSARAPPGPHRT